MIVPETVFWEVTSKCNFNCVHCYQGEKKGGTTRLSKETALSFVDMLHDGGIKTLLFMGGEPMVYPYLYDLVKKSGKYGYGLHAGVLTNGSLLTQSTVEKLKTSGVSAVQIGLDGIGLDYTRIRGFDFGSIHKSIRILKESKILVQAKFTVNGMNLNAFEGVWEYCKENKILLSTSLVLEIGNADRGVLPSPDDYFSLFLKMFEINENAKLDRKSFVLPDFSIGEYLTDGEPKTGCVAGRGICGITADNKFVPCIYLSGMDVKKVFGVEAPEFDDDFLNTFNHHPLFVLFREEASERFGCPIRSRLNGNEDPFGVNKFAEWVK